MKINIKQIIFKDIAIKKKKYCFNNLYIFFKIKQNY